MAGVFLPWLSFSQHRYDQVYDVYFSPFLLIINISGKEAHFWFQLNEGSTVVGLAALIGAILGLLGGGLNREKISGAGGILSLVATGLFPACVSGYYYDMRFNWGGAITAIGAACMMASLIVTAGFPRYNVLNLHKQWTFVSKKIPSKKVFTAQLELIAILGSIYSSYELSRLVYMALSSESITLAKAGFPSWLYRLEMLFCLYTVVYWFLRLGLKILDFLLFSEK